jgi:hypothetical protein
MLYVIANCGTGITWAFVISYLLGMCSAFDTSGRAAAIAGLASKVGLATGPLMGAVLQQSGSYGLLIDLSTAAIILCAIAAAIPARLLDRRAVEESAQASGLPAQT